MMDKYLQTRVREIAREKPKLFILFDHDMAQGELQPQNLIHMNFDDIEFYDKNEGFDVSKLSSLNKLIQDAMSEDELIESEEGGTFTTKPSDWVVSLRDLPSSYVDLLCYSDSGGIVNGEREIGYFGSSELREYLLSYQFPDYMQGCLPFGMNGGGVFYIFDMRESSGMVKILCQPTMN